MGFVTDFIFGFQVKIIGNMETKVKKIVSTVSNWQMPNVDAGKVDEEENTFISTCLINSEFKWKQKLFKEM